jgi:undecaprenyl diphosphate synthase
MHSKSTPYPRKRNEHVIHARGNHPRQRRWGSWLPASMSTLQLLWAIFFLASSGSASAFVPSRPRSFSTPSILLAAEQVRVNGAAGGGPKPGHPVDEAKPQEQRQQRSNTRTPCHIAFVCDGNSRWAAARNLPAAVGHTAGAERLVQVLRILQNTPGVEYCTMFGFSTENWKRPPNEIHDIFTVMERTARCFAATLLLENVIFKVVGDLDDERIPSSLRDILKQLEQSTLEGHKGDNVVTLCLAINYGGRQDILNASKRLARLVSEGKLNLEDGFSEELFASCLDTANIPDPDLIVRTSGENRLSNFLLWNAAYAELYFTSKLWPDFDSDSVDDALDWYSTRERRFGARDHSEG